MAKPRSNQISIYNLDASEQARLWQKFGPKQAMQDLLAAMRAALLIGETVFLDRNQLFEGVFFIAMTPERLAWSLGLEPGAQLPLTIQLFDSAKTNKPLHFPNVSINPIQARKAIANYWEVADDPMRVSSPVMSLCTSDAYTEYHASNVINVTRNQSFENLSDKAFLSETRWTLRTMGMTAELIERGRLNWLRVILEGTVSIAGYDPSDDLLTQPTELNVVGSSDRGRSGSEKDIAQQAELKKGTEHKNRIVSFLHSALPTEDRKNSLAQLLIQVTQDSHYTMGTKRSAIVKWLNGEIVTELVPQTLAEATKKSGDIRLPDTNEARLMLSWWVQGYYRAIADRDSLNMFQFYEPVTDEQDKESAEKYEVEWNLRPPRLSRRGALRQYFSRKNTQGSDVYYVSGSICEHMKDYTPGQFARLRKYSESNRKMRDDFDHAKSWHHELALAVEDGAVEVGKRKSRIFRGLKRAGFLLALALILELQDHFEDISTELWVSLLFLPVLAFSLLPWDQLGTLLKMSSLGLRSTLLITNKPQAKLKSDHK